MRTPRELPRQVAASIGGGRNRWRRHKLGSHELRGAERTRRSWGRGLAGLRPVLRYARNHQTVLGDRLAPISRLWGRGKSFLRQRSVR
jgi:hypothetical protein